ncbi:cytochrome c3 family protein [Rubrivivax sp. A210]|uniref:cytochrome c3 family protein n=1 Tax=Rubrivivax sp. A210 TaxID=2772301 RepID=UPI001917B73C|nr:cytochrome c3 family protein [Rubrivivax sp. A210]
MVTADPLLRWMRGLLALLALLVVQVGGLPPALAQSSGYDHTSTGFALRGKHEEASCESCHLRGIFKGTPRDCATCHVANNPRGAKAMPLRHVQTLESCDNCHSLNSFAGALFSHFGVAPGGCASCHNGVRAAGKSAGHPGTVASCDECHRTAAFLPAAAKQSNHIPTATGAACSACHSNPAFRVMPTLAAIHANAPSSTSGCATCHGAAAASFANPASGFAIVGFPANHIPTQAACENCHTGPGTGISALPVGNGARFSGALMNHAGIASGCVDCHRPAGSTVAFAGISAIVGMPPTAPAGPGAHIPSSTACESCHLASRPAGLVPASATRSAPGSGFATPAPGGAQIHAGVSAGCNACHEAGMVWMGMNAYPISPATLTAGAQYRGFQTRPRAAASSFSVANPAHPTGDDCSRCHSSTSAFSGVDKPANHIPYAASAQCNSCHTGTDYAVMPTLTAIHAFAPNPSGNCAQCHGAAAASFAIPANGFAIVGLPANHIPTSVGCEVCHVGPGTSIAALPVTDGARFAGSLMNHAGITRDCAACHQPSGSATTFAGITRIVGMPATNPAGAGAHIPSSTVCESCHLASMPPGLIAASATLSAPGTAFANPPPTGAQIHAGTTSGCVACHEAGMVWMGVAAYPISPATRIDGAQYTGFQTRPRAAAGPFNVADAAHPAAGDCSRCHSNTAAFTGVDKPANHIPYAATATCTSCHVNPDYAVTPSLAAIHANAPNPSGNCAQCHGAAAASFAIPAINFAIVGMPATHIPTTAACELCHVGPGSSIAALPVTDGARFKGSLMNHAGISANCASCHLPAGSSTTFAGIARLIGMPPTSPVGAGSHIPSSTTCESCHLASLPSGLIAASASKTAPGTGFATPAPTGVQIHNGVSSGCAACHEAGAVWMGMGAYPISPSTLTAGAQYKGFQTRPRAAAGSFNVADAAHPPAGDCSQCHGNTTAFTSVDKPANHIPFAATATCNACHTSSDYAVMPTLANIHANAPSTTTNCAQCHGAAAASFAIPAIGFSVVGMPTNHIPTSAACELCHVGPGSSIAALPVGNGARFSGSLMNHAGISANCVACHQPATATTTFAGITRLIGMPATTPAGPGSHIPSSTACEACHLASMPTGLVPASATKTAPGTGFATPAPSGTQIHAGVSSGCNACHEAGMVWLGVGAYPIAPTTLVAGASYTGFQTRPRAAAGTFNVANPAHPGTGDCSQCHGSTSAFTGVDRPANHIPFATSAQCSGCHTGSDYAVFPTLTAIHANAPNPVGGCAQCHGAAAASFALPAVGFSVIGMPVDHIPTNAGCETCHVGPGSSIAALPVTDGARFSGSLMSHAGIASGCAACHMPNAGLASFAGIAAIVKQPRTSPVGPDAHIPTTAACEACHLASTPAGLIPASAVTLAPGTGFAIPAPTGAQIHAGVSSGCSACHETGYQWMGINAYPPSPTTLTPGAQYRGFQTRPTPVASATSVADPAHPAGGDCSQCHTGTTAFTGVAPPANHIPFAAQATCNACHLGSDYAVRPTLANIHRNAPSTTGNCAQCHGAAAASFAIPASNFSIVGLPADHIPTSASCELCHVGAGSSIAALPVPDGARFAGSLMNHAGISSGCVACHQPAGATTRFAGITALVGMPPTSPVGGGSHIPSGTACEACHLASMPALPVPASATKTAPGTGFATPAPTGAQIHAGVSSSCSACHETGAVWMGMGAYPITPTTLTAGALYRGFQTRPVAAAGLFSVADPAHPLAGDCSQCHSNTTAFSGVDKPANHIPYAASAQCNSCHTSSDYAVRPTLTAIHANAPSSTSNCAQCHGAAAASFAIPRTGFAIVGQPANHIPTSTACEVCHVGPGSSIAALPVTDGARFAGSLMNHAGIAGNCAACHLPAGNATTFAGITRIVGMPATSPPGSGSHIPSTTNCETCHLASMPAGLIAASATATAPGTGFASAPPGGAQIHSGVTAGCAGCHEAGMVWMGMGAYPISPATLVPGGQYRGFQTRPGLAASAFAVADPAHPAAGDCVQCHSSTTAFTGVEKPGNHIPYAASAQCANCHTSSDYSVVPTLANIHANAPSVSGNCAQCHGSAAPSFAIPRTGFAIVGQPANHIPTNQSCEVCHVGAGSSITALPVADGARFAGSQMNHAGITSTCSACHLPSGSSTSFAGIARIVAMPPTSPPGSGSHIPSSPQCETCHLASLPVGMIPATATATAPGTGFASPAPSGTQIHTGITAGCAACHEAGMVWMGVAAYPISPAQLSPGASYRGFQTRPRAAASTFSVADPSHPAAGDCSQCHGNTTAFTGIDKPGNHIPYTASASCDNCHTSADYAVMPTLANIHLFSPNPNGGCDQCHGAAAASFAIPAANFAIVGKPANHIPTSAGCEVCHVGPGSSIAALPVADGARFANSLMNHAGISSNCAACHVAAGTTAAFAGISRIVGMPPTTPMGAGAHIPSSTTCEACHLASLPAGLIPASATRSAPGSGFATPAPTGTQIHAGVTSGCAACHESNYVWMGVAAYPITPTTVTAGAQYKGFQTRPRAAAGTFNVANATHPATGDCSQCHSGTTAFSAIDKPANHIPYAATAACNACHTGSNFSIMPTLAAIHANAQSTTANCAQCHGATAASFAIPANGFAIVGLPANHIPTSASCEVCHVGPGSSIAATPVPNGARFSGSLMSHAGITSNCVACHVTANTPASFAGITRIVVMPPTSPVGAGSHIPSSTACETCHLGSVPAGLVAASATKTAPGTGFATPAPTGAQIHSGVTSGCAACHESGSVWMGMSAYPITPAVLTAGAQYRGFQTRPRAAAGSFNIADAGHPAGGDCSLCHANTTAFVGVDKPANHIPTAATAQCTNCHTGTDYAVMPTLANIHLHAPSTTANCAQCHGATTAATFAIPAANFSIVGLPSNHIPTTASCEVCHVGPGSSIPTLPVPNGARFAGSLMSHAGITTGCINCHVAAGTVTSFAGITRIVGMPPTSPVGAGAHIPSSTACQACHSTSSVSGLIPASATRTAPGTLFATPVPTGAQIHTGITSGCNACHESGFVWMGMGNYPITPTVITSGAQYKGFQTRPRATAGTFNVLDAGHPATGDCSQCHTGTSFFDGAAKPTGHIPTNGNCSTCHIVAGDFSVAGLASNTALHTGITANCRSCHVAGAGAGPFAGCATQAACRTPVPLTYQPKTMPLLAGGSPTAPSASTHIPVGNVACERCHSATNFTTFKLAGTNPMRPNTAGGIAMHNAVPPATFTCMSCHERPYTWFGVVIKTRDADHLAKPARAAPHDCDEAGCHKVGASWSAVLRPIPVRRAAVGNALPRLLPREILGLPAPRAGAGFDHRGVTVGQCQTCHNGQLAKARPAKHFGAKLSCDACHRTTAWTPAQFSHPAQVTGRCAACHNGVDASARPGTHFVTVRSCDSCHRPLAWQPVRYQHLSPAYLPLPDRPSCVSCHITNGEVIPRQLHGNPRVRPVPVPGRTGP